MHVTELADQQYHPISWKDLCIELLCLPLLVPGIRVVLSIGAWYPCCLLVPGIRVVLSIGAWYPGTYIGTI